MGVAQAWVFDPQTQKGWISTVGGVTEWSGGILQVPVTIRRVAFARMVQRRQRRGAGQDGAVTPT